MAPQVAPVSGKPPHEPLESQANLASPVFPAVTVWRVAVVVPGDVTGKVAVQVSAPTVQESGPLGQLVAALGTLQKFVPQFQLKYDPALVTAGILASEHKFTAGAAATGVEDAAEPQIKVDGVQK